MKKNKLVTRNLISTFILMSSGLLLSAQGGIDHRKYVIRGVAEISIPNTLELQSAEMQRLSDSMVNSLGISLGITLPLQKAVFQQTGLNANLKASFDTYARVILSVIQIPDVEFANSDDIRNATEAEMKELDSIFKKQTEESLNKGVFNIRLIAWYGCQRVQIGARTALRMSYARAIGDNPPVQVIVHRFYNKTSIISLTQSYRIQDEIRWKNDMDYIMQNFNITFSE